jgi:hypothetical protein
MIGTENTASAAPFGNGVNWADLFRFELDIDARQGELQFTDSLECKCGAENGNFDAAAGIHVDTNGILSLYTAFHWRINNELRMAEFHGRAAPDAPMTSTDECCIELYDNTDFRGRCLALHGTADATLPDYSQLFVQGDDFDDTVASVRFRLPQGAVYRLYRTTGFQGAVPGTDFIDLIGTGGTTEIADLNVAPLNFGDRVRSSRFLS